MGTIAFDVITLSASRVNARHIEKAASKQNMSLRTVCFLNSGAAESVFKRLTYKRVRSAENEQLPVAEACIQMPPTLSLSSHPPFRFAPTTSNTLQMHS